MTDGKLFNEDSLRAEIADRWGEHGAHVEVFDHLLELARAGHLLESVIHAPLAGVDRDAVVCAVAYRMQAAWEPEHERIVSTTLTVVENDEWREFTDNAVVVDWRAINREQWENPQELDQRE